MTSLGSKQSQRNLYSRTGGTSNSNAGSLNYKKALEVHMMQQHQTGLLNRKVDFFSSLLDKTNKNIEVIASQLSEIQRNQLKQQEMLRMESHGPNQIPWTDINDLQEILRASH